MKVKVKDIAAAAGVSTTAVSLVLNNRPSRIADDTKEHILRIANEMKLQKENDFLFAEFKRVKTIGLIIPEGNNRFFWKLALEISKVAAVSGYTVFQCHVEESSQSLYQAIESLVGKNVDGILVVPPAKITKEGIKLLKSCQTGKIPMILVDRAVYTVFSDFVTADNKQGGLLATEYLIAHGHTRIGIILGGENVYTSRTRLEGYKAALAAHSIPYEIMRVYYGDFDTQSGETGAEELLKQGVTAIFAANDLMAYGVYSYAGRKGLVIPDDLSVIGYDNTELCDFLPVPLTSIDQNIENLASKSVEVMTRQIMKSEQQSPVRNYYFSPIVVERSSVKYFLE